MHRLKYENQLFSSGIRLLGGLDEAGRGPLAGPVVAACVAARPGYKISGKELKKVRDSKLLTEKAREKLYGLLLEEKLEIGIGICTHQEIDKINIFQASLLAMKKAMEKLESSPDYLVLDGKFRIPNLIIKQEPIIGGDNKVFLIAAASIIAKVTRDRMMKEFHEQYPLYGFNRHKGYATSEHCQKLDSFGPCPIHRKTFSPIRQFVV